jgi:arylsulfatase
MKKEFKNLVLLTLDSLRADHMGIYGYNKNTSLNMDVFSKNGYIFFKAYSEGSHTSTSFPSILSFDTRIKKNTVFLSQVLKANGYVTCGIHSNPFLQKYKIGFDHYLDLEDLTILSENKGKMNILSNFQNKFFNGKKRRMVAYEFSKLYQAFIAKKRTPYARCEIVNDRAIDLLKKIERPFFIWLHYMDVHMPYIPPSGFRPRINSLKIYTLNQKLLRASRTGDSSSISDEELDSLIDLYDYSLRYFDSEFAKFIRELRKLGIDAGNTFFIVTSDHGEEFKEYGGIGHNNPANVNEFLLHVPLIIIGPDINKKIISEKVTLQGLCPTILKLLDLKIPSRLRERIFADI